MLKTMTFRAILMAVACALSYAAHARADAPRKVDVPAGELTVALRALADQAGVEFVYSADELKGIRTNGVHGEYTTQTAVTKLLEGTKLKLTIHESGAMLIALPRLDTIPLSSAGPGASSFGSGEPLPVGERASVSGNRLAQATNPSPGKGEEGARDGGMVREATEGQDLPSPEDTGKTIPEILVKGSKSLNMDIQRTRDDVLPYVVFDRKRIEQSGAINIEDFLKRRLTMNTQSAFNNQSGAGGNSSQFDLRGLGTDETLILVDGHRLASNASSSEQGQPDINGIPLFAVERIEVLPSSASGIYGGSATGGVINIILRRDFNGSELQLSYDNTIDSDAGRRQVDLATGLSFEGGKSSLLFIASYADQNVLALGERDFPQQYYAEALANNPAVLGNRPPLGATPNLRSVDGSNLRLDNGTLLSSSFTHVPEGYAGPSTDGGAALVANAGTYNLASADSFQSDNGKKRALANSPTVEALRVLLRREFNPSVQAFLEVAASNNLGDYVTGGLSQTGFTLPANAAGNPFQQNILVVIPGDVEDTSTTQAREHTDRRLVAGVIAKLPGSWQAEADFTWDRTDFSAQLPPGLTAGGTAVITNGTPSVLRDLSVFPLDLSPYVLSGSYIAPFNATLRDAALRLVGPAMTLPGGDARISLLLERRDEFIDELASTSFSAATGLPSSVYVPHRSQTVDSAYAEALIPLVSSRNRRPFVHELELQVSGRHDVYASQSPDRPSFTTPNTPINYNESQFSSTDAVAGLRWSPAQDIMLRVSYGTGFLPPTINQLRPPAPQTFATGVLFDPRRGNTSFALPAGRVLAGGNPDLEPEKSKSWTGGVILTPRFVEGLRLSVDYTKIEKVDNISGIPGSTQGLINNESLFPERITRAAPTPAEQALGWAGAITQLDISPVNLSSAEVEAYDIQLDYQRETVSFGSFEFYGTATWQTRYRTQSFTSQPVIENVGYLNSPIEFKANAGLNWSYKTLKLGWSTAYWDSYRPYASGGTAGTIANAVLTQGSDRVEDQIYHDAFASYRFETGVGVLQGTEITLGLRNVFNTAPPRLLNAYSPYGDPRLASYYLSVSNTFGW